MFVALKFLSSWLNGNLIPQAVKRCDGLLQRCIVLHPAQFLVEGLTLNRPIVTDFYQGVDKSFQIDHPRGHRQSAPVIDLLIDRDARWGVVDVNVYDVIVRELKQFFHRTM